MLRKRFFQLLAALMVLAFYTSQVAAQHELHRGPPVIDPNGYDPDLTQPFIEPFTFDPDFQFFAPTDVDRLGGEIEDSVGWFATYDRTYTYVTRPQDEPSHVQGDFTWGSRYTFGYMTAEDHGWSVGFMHIDGPNENRILEQERINVFEPDDQINIAPDAVALRGAGGGGGGGATPGVIQPGFPVRDRNDVVTLERDYRVFQSINDAKVSGFELNKTFRIDALHYGSVIEPFFGFRFNNVDDFFRHDVYERFDTTTGALVFTTDVPGVFIPPPGTPLPSTEQFTSVQTHFDNNMFGGQLGMRWYKQKSRWNLSGEVRAFGLQNFQNFNRSRDIERTQYAGGTAASAINVVQTQRFVDSGHAAEFVFGTELRAEAAYSLTKYIKLRGGVQFFDFARGIGRGNDLVRNDQDLLLVGYTLGVEVNR